MARIPYPKLEDLPDKIRTAAERLPPLNIMRMFLNAPTNAIPLLSFGQSILTRQELDARLRELAILRVAHLTGATYEWTQHVQIAAEEAGMTEADFAAIEVGSTDPLWALEEKAALQLVEELFASKTLEDNTWKELGRYYSELQIMDMVAAVGNYTMVSMMLKTFQVPLDDWLERYERF